MTGFYISKFRPNKKHIIAYVFLFIALVLFISGAHRAFRVMGRLDQTGLSFEGEGYIKKNDGLLFDDSPIKGTLRDGSEEFEIGCAHISRGFFRPGYEMFVVHIADKYRYVCAIEGSEEYNALFGSEGVTGYFTDKYSDYFTDYVSKMDKIYDPDSVIPEAECSELGIIVVDRQKELLSFIWGIPFLVVGLFFLKKAGSPFFYIPEDIVETED